MNETLRKHVKRHFARLVAGIWGRSDRSARQVLDLQPGRILLIRQHNQMGDMVCATPVFRAIRETWPHADIGLVCAPLNADVVRHSPHLDRIFLFDKRGCRDPRRAWSFIRELRIFSPDLVFVLSSVSFSVTSALMALASGAPVIVGSDTRPFGWDFADRAFSLVLPAKPAPDRHAVEHNLEPLQAMGIDTADLDTVVCSSVAEERIATDYLKSLSGGDRPLWLMSPGAGKVTNLWPAERFADLAERAAVAGRRVLVLQGPADVETMRRFTRALQEDAGSREIHIAPVKPVGVCVALLAEADRFLCNDTGMMHVAGAVGVPTLALFGPTDPEIWRPRSPLLSVLRGRGGDVKNLSADEVWEALVDLATGSRPAG